MMDSLRRELDALNARIQVEEQSSDSMKQTISHLETELETAQHQKQSKLITNHR